MLLTTEARLRELHPEGLDAMRVAHSAAWAAVDPIILESCRLLVADLLADEPSRAWRSPAAVAAGLDEERVAALSDWRRDPRFTPDERAHFAFTEQFVTSVGNVSEAEVDALLEHRDPERVYAFIDALYLLEMTQRLDAVLRATLEAEERAP